MEKEDSFCMLNVCKAVPPLSSELSDTGGGGHIVILI